MSQLLNGQFMIKGLAIAVTTLMVGTAHAAKTEQQQIQELRQEVEALKFVNSATTASTTTAANSNCPSTTGEACCTCKCIK